jgi:hypothetical protein
MSVEATLRPGGKPQGQSVVVAADPAGSGRTPQQGSGAGGRGAKRILSCRQRGSGCREIRPR